MMTSNELVLVWVCIQRSINSAELLRNGTDSQRDEQPRENDSNTVTSAAVESALVDLWTKRLQMLTVVVSHWHTLSQIFG